MKNLFKNKKQKAVWIICVILILIDLMGATSCCNNTSGDFLIPLIGYVVISFILTSIMQDR
jgi:hypothetical protein